MSQANKTVIKETLSKQEKVQKDQERKRQKKENRNTERLKEEIK